MEKQFVTYKIGLILEKLGFDEPCLGFFDANGTLILGIKPEYLDSKEKANYIFGNDKVKIILAPLWQQALDWIRDVDKSHIMIYVNSDNEGDDPIKWFYSYCCKYNDALSDNAFCCTCDEDFESHYDALKEAIEVVLDIMSE